MIAQWTAEVVGQMHIHNITQQELAEELGCTREYVNIILNGKRSPAGIEEKVRVALHNAVSKKSTAGRVR